MDYHLLQYAGENGMRWNNLKRLVLGGEKVPLGMRSKLKQLCATMGSDDVDIISTYGFTEAKMAFSECCPPKGEGGGLTELRDLLLLLVYPFQCFFSM